MSLSKLKKKHLFRAAIKLQIMIEGQHVNLRALEETDLNTLKKWRNDEKNRIHTREYRLLSMINQKNWFESIHKENPPKVIMFGVVSKNGAMIGVCGITYIDWKNRHAEISIILSLKDWQKTKEAKDTVNLLLNYGFGELNMHRLWVEIFTIIPQNIKLFEQLHFTKEGMLRDKLWRNGKWYDSFIYSKLSNEKINEK